MASPATNWLIMWVFVLGFSRLSLADGKPLPRAQNEAVVTTTSTPQSTGCGPFALHASLSGVFAQADDLSLAGLGESGISVTTGGDLVLGEQFAFSLISGIHNFAPGDRGRLRDIFVGAGFRMFFRIDESAALTEEGGSALGKVWLDAHLAFHRYRAENHMGLDIGLGYDFELGRELDVGPVARVQFVPWGDGLHYGNFSIGIRISLGGSPPLADRDGDAVYAEADQCPGERETKNGFEDDDGCPDEPKR